MSVLNSGVLVLNKSYIPLRITTVKDAIVKLFIDKVEVVMVYEDGKYGTYNFNSWVEMSSLKLAFDELKGDESWIETARLSIETPRIIRELEYNKVRVKTVRFSRRNILLRDGYICQYCNKKFDSKNLNIDHVIPSSRGGATTWENTVCACFSCNNKKGNKTPKEAKMKLIRKPFKPKFIPTFRFTASKTYKDWEHFLNEVYWNVKLRD